MMTGLRSLTERLMVMSAGGGTISDEWRATAHGFSTNCLPSWVRLRSWNTVYILSLYCSFEIRRGMGIISRAPAQGQVRSPTGAANQFGQDFEATGA